MTRVQVFASPSVRDTAFRWAGAQARTLAQFVAERTRAILATPKSGLPGGEPMVTWRDLNHSLLLTAYRDGRLVWRVSSDTAGAVQAGDGGVRLMARALDMARGANGTYLSWPAGLLADSVPFQIDLVHPLQGRPTGGTLQVPVFTVGVPEEEPVRAITLPTVRYPKLRRLASKGGTVLLQYVVDTAGRVDLTSVREMPLADAQRLSASIALSANMSETPIFL